MEKSSTRLDAIGVKELLDYPHEKIGFCVVREKHLRTNR
jgi:hypothetical protein